MFRGLWCRTLMMCCNEEQFCQVWFQFCNYFELTHCFLELDTKTQNLSMLTQKYKKDATYLNTKSMYVKAAAGCIVVFVIFLYFWVL